MSHSVAAIHPKRAASYRLPALLAALAALVLPAVASAQGTKVYDPGASDTEIKIGQTYPYSGPLSSASDMALTQAAYFKMINDEGGINGRKIAFMSLDDTYSPPKAVEQTRRLVERDEVLLIFNSFGSPTSAAVQKYLNGKKIPQLFASTGGARFTEPGFPWSSSALPNYVDAGRMIGSYITTRLKNTKVAVLFQNDDFGKDYMKGIKEAFAREPSVQIVAESSYEPAQPTVDSQIATLANSGATVFVNITTGRSTVQSIRTLASLDWKPTHILNGQWADISSVFKPAGLKNSAGIITTRYIKAPDDPAWADDKAIREYKDFMAKHRPGSDANSKFNIQGYFYAQVLIHILKEAGNALTRENINAIAMNLTRQRFDVLIPSVTITTTPEQRNLIHDEVFVRFDGEKFVPIEQ